MFDCLGVNVYIDPKSLFYLSGTVLDFSDGLNGKGFVFNNPAGVAHLRLRQLVRRLTAGRRTVNQ